MIFLAEVRQSILFFAPSFYFDIFIHYHHPRSISCLTNSQIPHLLAMTITYHLKRSDRDPYERKKDLSSNGGKHVYFVNTAPLKSFLKFEFFVKMKAENERRGISTRCWHL